MDTEGCLKLLPPEHTEGASLLKIMGAYFEKHPLNAGEKDRIFLCSGISAGRKDGAVYLGMASQTNALIYAADTEMSPEDCDLLGKWGIRERFIPYDTRDKGVYLFPTEEKFRALLNINSYHYFCADKKGYFENNILPSVSDGGEIMICVPGVKDHNSEQTQRCIYELIGDEWYQFWAEHIGKCERAETTDIRDMGFSEEAWDMWLAGDARYLLRDSPARKNEYIQAIKPGMCFIGIYVKLK